MRIVLGSLLLCLFIVFQSGCNTEPGSSPTNSLGIGAELAARGKGKSKDPVPNAYVSTQEQEDLIKFGDIAPLIAGEGWINSKPLTKEDLLGKLVIVNFGEYW